MTGVLAAVTPAVPVHHMSAATERIMK